MQRLMRSPVIAVISLSIIFLGWQQITAGILQGLGRTVIPMIAIFIGLLAKTFLDYELTGTIELGINGAAWATNLNFAIAALINYIFVKKYVGSVLNKLESIKNCSVCHGYGRCYTGSVCDYRRVIRQWWCSGSGYYCGCICIWFILMVNKGRCKS